jgi:hypothetical protein
LGSGGVVVWNRAGKIRYTEGSLPPDVLMGSGMHNGINQG